MTAIRIESLSVDLRGRPALRDVSFDAAGGTLIALAGPNGAGKTTLLRSLLGLARPAHGRVFAAGRDVKAWPRRTLARTLAYLPQGAALHWPLTGLQTALLGRAPHLGVFGAPTEADRAAALAALTACGAAHLADRPMDRASAGERALVLFARALAVDAPVLLADEPAAALDPHHALQVMELLAAQARAGRLVIAALHDLTLAARFCDRVLLLAGGKLIADGPPRAVLSEGPLSAAFRVTPLTFEADGHAYVLPWRRLETHAAE